MRCGENDKTFVPAPRDTKEEQVIKKSDKTVKSPERTLSLIQESLDSDKAENIVTIELAGKSSIADFMVIASGQSNRHVNAMTDHLVKLFKDNGLKGTAVEGQARGDWVVVDAGDVIVHLFRPEVRDFYNLEKLWSFEMPDAASVSQASNDQSSAAHSA